MKVFISGSISIKKIPLIAIKKIDNIIEKGYFILIGDANGIDSCVQKYLEKKNYSKVTVYYAGEKIRNNFGKWKTKNIKSVKNEKGRDLYTLKDIQMSNDADYGLKIWDGESRGTINNIKMMKQQNKKFFVVMKEVLIDDKKIDLFIKTNKPKETTEKQMDLF